jgi:hypothetical protein
MPQVTLIDDDSVSVGVVGIALGEIGLSDQITSIIENVEMLGEYSFEVDDLELAILAFGTRDVPFNLH